MLREIHIQNYAVIDNLAVEFGPGLNLLSGETGSGKSILVDALGLALGAAPRRRLFAPERTARWSPPFFPRREKLLGPIGWRNSGWRRAMTVT